MPETHQILHSEWERVNWEVVEARDLAEQEKRTRMALEAQVQKLKAQLDICRMTEKKERCYKGRIAELTVSNNHLEALTVSQYPRQTMVSGVGPNAEIVANERGGQQSKVAYRLDLLPPLAALTVGQVLDYGARRYAEENWRKISVKDHLNHLLIHVVSYLAGDKSDDHLSHAATRAMFALELDLVARRADAAEDEYREGGNAD